MQENFKMLDKEGAFVPNVGFPKGSECLTTGLPVPLRLVLAAAEDGSGATEKTQMELASACPTLADVGIWGMSQQMEDMSLYLSNKN